MNSCGRGLVENEKQDKKELKSIVVEEQEDEEEEGSESETRFVDLSEDVLHNVLQRVDVATLGRAACVNKRWRTAAWDDRLWEPFVIRHFLRSGGYGRFDMFRKEVPRLGGFRRFRSLCLQPLIKPPPSDFYSIDPTVFAKEIRPWT